MSMISDLTDEITGGANGNAAADLQQALAAIQTVQTPTTQQLQLGPLAQYASTGELNPALAAAAQTGPSAYNSEVLSSVPMATMQQALAQEKAIADAQGMTPQEQAAIAQAEQSVNRNTAGQRGAIAADFAQRGVPQSLIAAALQNATAGQDAQQAYENALQARGQAAQQGITALQNEGALAGQMYAQESGQANTVAAAQNALAQFNASNTQQTNLSNQAAQQQANAYNTQNAQSLANQNVQTSQQRQYQNQVEAPQEAANLALEKAGAEANVGQARANQQTAAGQQSAGLFGGLLGAGATLGAGALSGRSGPVVLGLPGYGNGPIQAAEGGEIPRPNVPAINFRAGGPVPGVPRVAGDSPVNDTVPARLSPGEFVVPRSAMARPSVRDFLTREVPTPRPPTAEAHPSDVASILKALAMLRAGPEAA